NNNESTLAVQGSISLTLPGDANSLSVSVTGDNYLYIGAQYALGFALSGATIGVSTSFTVVGVQFDGNVNLSLSFGNTGHTLSEVSFYGDVTVKTNSASDHNYDLNFSANFGSSAAPGLEFENGSLKAINVSFTGGVGATKNDPALGGLGITIN